MHTQSPDIKIGFETEMSLFSFFDQFQWKIGITGNYVYYINQNGCANQSIIDFDVTKIILRLKN